jgi:hypothetical protein
LFQSVFSFFFKTYRSVVCYRGDGDTSYLEVVGSDDARVGAAGHLGRISAAVDEALVALSFGMKPKPTQAAAAFLQTLDAYFHPE